MTIYHSHKKSVSELILKLKKEWELKLLNSNYLKEIDSFIELFHHFFQLCEGQNGTGLGILNACPSSKNIHQDKFVLGLYDSNLLIGLVDIITDYPKQSVWTIGYLLIHPMYQSQGLGSQFIKDLEKALNIKKLRCVVQEQNTRALAFWKSNGFLITSQQEDRLGKQINLTYILEKWLK